MPARCRMTVVLAAGAICVSATGGRAADWPNWHGPTYDGHSTETGFKTAWSGELPIAWQQRIGPGFSGITTAAGRAYTCGTADGQQTLFCLDAATGKVRWQTAFEKAYRSDMGSGTRATPTIDAGRVYIFGALGTVACLDAANGSKVWSRRFDHAPHWGYAGSVLIRGRLAILTTGGQDGALRALDKQTGRTIWRCGSDGDSGYSTPYPFRFEGGDYVCGFLGKSVVIAEEKTGREVFHMPWTTDWKVNATTPIFHNGYLFVTSGYHTGCGLYRLRRSGEALEAEEVWRSKVLKNKFQTPVLYRGKLYSFDQRAFSCVDFLTGKREWRESGRHGTVLLADGHLIALTEQGRLRIGPASPASFQPTGESDVLDDRCWTVPTLSDGRLFARNMERIVCVDLRK